MLDSRTPRKRCRIWCPCSGHHDRGRIDLAGDATGLDVVDRDLGDLIQLDISGVYKLSEGFSFSLLYIYRSKFKDDISGDKGFAYESLEKETDLTEHVGIVGLSYSTISLYKAKKFPVPLTTSITYRDRFAGTNNVWKSQYISLGLEFFF